MPRRARVRSAARRRERRPSRRDPRASAGGSCSRARRDAPDLGGRELADAWETALEGTGLPAFVPAGRARARVAFAAPVSAGLVAEAELADIFLTEFEPTWRVREALAGVHAGGLAAGRLYDVWLGAPAAGRPGRRGRLSDRGRPAAEAADIARAAAAILAADRLPRERQKGTTTVTYDLRPLLDRRRGGRRRSAGGRSRPDAVPPGARHRPAGGGRRGAAGTLLGVALVVGSVVRERLILADGLQIDRSSAIDRFTLGVVHSAFCASAPPRVISCPMSRSPRAVARHES